MPVVRRQYVGIALIAMIVSTTIVYLDATRPSRATPVKLTLFNYPEDLFGVREESPSLVMSLVCQRKIGVLDIRFISSVKSTRFDDIMGQRFEDPSVLLKHPPLSNLSHLFTGRGAAPRVLREKIELDGELLTVHAFDFDASSGGLLESGPFLVFDFLFNSTNHLVGSFRGMEDFFVRPEDTLEYIGLQLNQNVTEYLSEERAGALMLADRPRGGLARFHNLSSGDVISITLRWKPNIKAASLEAKNALSGPLFMERIEVLADGSPVDLDLDTLLIRNLG